MSDFYQNGIISTLHNLRTRSLSDLETDLKRFSKTRPMTLVLPSLFSELEKPALQLIVDELKKVNYLDSIVIGLDQATKEQYQYALQFFNQLPQKHFVLWNDGPRLLDIDQKLKKFDLSPKELGKGRNVWFCFGFVLADGTAKSVALHDCDIVTYNRELLARLIYPVANPNFNYQFCKGYYSRVTH
ncbi:MAG: glycosyl transferase, partial [Methylophilaceae bacterium]